MHPEDALAMARAHQEELQRSAASYRLSNSRPPRTAARRQWRPLRWHSSRARVVRNSGGDTPTLMRPSPR
jgi:hypothetical protein